MTVAVILTLGLMGWRRTNDNCQVLKSTDLILGVSVNQDILLESRGAEAVILKILSGLCELNRRYPGSLMPHP